MATTGTVKSFNVTKGFGFITMADGSDIFVHAKSCTDGGVPKVGDILSFTMEPSEKSGKMQATNVTGGTGIPGPGGKGIQGTGSMQGTCKSFNAEKGFGFITGADGSDVFVHRSGMVDGSTPQAGDTITFDVEPSKQKPDQMQAVNATGGTGYDTGKGGKGGGWGMDSWGGGGWGGGGYGASKGGWGGGGGGKGGPYGGGKGKGGGWGGGW
jgi:cold shock CspA family protein